MPGRQGCLIARTSRPQDHSLQCLSDTAIYVSESKTHQLSSLSYITLGYYWPELIPDILLFSFSRLGYIGLGLMAGQERGSRKRTPLLSNKQVYQSEVV